MAAESNADYSNPKELEKAIKNTRKQMENAAKDMDFLEAVKLRDKLTELKKLKK
jgi:excinuclease ABC subunit B